MEIIKEGTNRQQASGDFSCGCDYCQTAHCGRRKLRIDFGGFVRSDCAA